MLKVGQEVLEMYIWGIPHNCSEFMGQVYDNQLIVQ